MNLQYTLSIKKNTNKLISSSLDKFIGISNNTLIKLEDDPTLHIVTGRESFFYIKTFKTQNSKIIILDEDVDVNLQKGDILKISYKEYEGKFISKIIDAGKDYRLNDNLSVKGGLLSIDISSGMGEPTLFEVKEINLDGSIKDIDIKLCGRYISYPDNPVETYSKNGQGLKLDIKYVENSNRSLIERIVNDIYFSDGKTYIVLDYSLPPNLIEGKISCEKNILLLSSIYTGDTKKNSSYQIFTHFTPNINLPLLIKGSLSSEIVLNKSLLIIDEEIGKIKKQLKIN